MYQVQGASSQEETSPSSYLEREIVWRPTRFFAQITKQREAAKRSEQASERATETLPPSQVPHLSIYLRSHLSLSFLRLQPSIPPNESKNHETAMPPEASGLTPSVLLVRWNAAKTCLAAFSVVGESNEGKREIVLTVPGNS